MTTTRYDGIDLAELSSLNVETTGADHIYVAADGDDDNPGIVTAPLATVAAVWAHLPVLQTRPFVLHLGPGTFAYTPPPENLQLGARAFIVVVGDQLTEVVTGTIGEGTTVDALKPSFTTTSEQYTGYTLEMTSGAAAGCRRHVSQDDANLLWMSAALVDNTGTRVTAATGDAFRLVRAATQLTVPAKYLSESTCRLHLVNVALSGVTGGTTLALHQQGFVHLLGVELRGASTAVLAIEDGAVSAGSTLAAGSNPAYRGAYEAFVTIQGALGLALFTGQWEGWGLTSTEATVRAVFSGSALFDGYLVLSSYFETVGMANSLSVLGGRVSRLYLGGAGVTYVANNGACPLILSGPGTRVTMLRQARLQMLAPVRINVTDNVAILYIIEQAEFYYTGGGTWATAGTSAGAIQAANQAKIQFATSMTISSAGGMFVVSGDASVVCTGNMTLSQGFQSSITRNGQLVIQGALSLVSSYTAAAIVLADSAVMSCGSTVSITGGVNLHNGATFYGWGATTISATTNSYAVQLGQNARFLVNAACTLTQDATSGATYCLYANSGPSTFTCTTLNATLGSAGGTAISVTDARINCAGVITINSAGVCFNVRSTVIYTPGLTATGLATGLNQLRSDARLLVQGACSITGLLNIDWQSCLFVQTTYAQTGQQSGISAVLTLNNGSRASFLSSSSAGFSVANTGAGDAVAAENGASFDVRAVAPVATAPRYAVNLRGGARAIFFNDPTGIVGTVGDFIIGPNTTDTFSRSELVTAQASRVSGLTGVARR